MSNEVDDSGFSKAVLAVIIYFTIYLSSIILNSDFWGYILSPIGALISFAIIINTYIKSSKINKLPIAWLVYASACLVWAIADIIWAIYWIVFGIDPSEFTVITILYYLPNVFLCLALLTFTIYQFRKWNRFQLAVDIITVASSSILFIWILIFNKSFKLLAIICVDGLASVTCVVIDYIITIGIIVWYLSVRTGKMPLYSLIIAAGLIVFVFTDLYYYYIYYSNMYIPNTLIDAAYIASFLIIALGANYFKSNLSSKKNENEGELGNIGFQNKGFLILIYPILIIIFKKPGVYSFFDLLAFIFIIAVYEVISKFVQESIKNEQLLKREKEVNIILEELIAERTKELIEKNKQLIEKNKELDFLSNQDTVTKLYNRRYFITTLDEKISNINKSESLALLFIDLDRFKTINDTYGHDVGDQVLIEISGRMHNLGEKNAFLARLGGDEFVIAIHGYYNYNNVEEIANKLISSCNEAIFVEDHAFHITLSIGISIYPLDAKDSCTLMKNADIAMYHAKSLGYNKYVSFCSVLKDKLDRKNEIEMLLKKADFNKEFELYYQPQFSLPDKKIVGIEALLRWNNPDNGSISPSELIPIAEEMDYSISIGEWVMKQAITQIATWNKKYSLQLKMGINISMKQIDNTNFVNELIKVMNDRSVNTDWLDIEITESIAIEGEYRISEISNIFKGVGVSISIDDFGTDFCSLSYLKLFPFDRIKIAKPLIDVISTDNYDMQMVKTIILLAKALGIRTIAEGVEFQDQLDVLIDLGCEAVQGYLLGRPMPAYQFEKNFLNIT